MDNRGTRRLFIVGVCAMLVCWGTAVSFGSGVSSATKRNTITNAQFITPTSTAELTPTSDSQQEIKPISEIEGGFTTSVVSGTLAYLDEAQALAIVDLGVVEQPVRRAHVPLPAASIDMAIEGNTLYVAAEHAVFVFDVHEANTPTLIGSFESASPISRLQVVNGLMYLAGDEFQVVDARRPEQMLRLGHTDLPTACYNMQIVGGRAYIVGKQLQIIDIGNPSIPTLLSSTGNSTYTNVQVVNTLAYVRDTDDTLLIFDISNPSHPTLAARYSASGISFFNLQIPAPGSFAYSLKDNSSSSELQILDLSDPLHPIVRSRLTIQGQDVAYRLQVQGNQAFLTSTNRLTVLSVAAPDAPVQISDFGSLWRAGGIKVINGLAYIAERDNGLVIVDVTDPVQPKLRGSVIVPGSASDVQVVGNLAYVAADYAGGLQIIDVSDPDRPHVVGSYLTRGRAVQLQVVGTLAYVSDYYGGLAILDVSDPAHPRLLGRFFQEAFSTVLNVQVINNIAYLRTYSETTNKNNLVVLDVRDPAAPVVLNSYELEGGYYGSQVVGNLLYLINSNELTILDLKEPSEPVAQEAFPSSSLYNIQVEGDTAFLSGSSNFLVVDVRDPAYPYLRTSYNFENYVSDVQVEKGLAFVTADNELQILDIPKSLIFPSRSFLPLVIQPEATPYPDETPFITH